MTRVFSMILIVFMALLMMHFPALAMNHGQNPQMTGEAKSSARPGENIHNATVNGHQFAYYLIDMQKHRAKMSEMSQMQGMKTSHHMMVYVTDPEGKLLDQAQVGYLVVGPDGVTQKQMGMDMQGGFGADLHFGEKGTYTVKTKAVAHGKTLMDQFTYEVK